MNRSVTRWIAPVVVCALGWAQPAAAQSILRDAETEALFADISKPMILAAGLSPNTAKVVLIQDNEINAFTAGGQTVYVNSGLLMAADNANELQGVIAHELGHVADGHVVLADSGIRPAMGIQIVSMVLGLAAIAAGAGEAGAGIMAAGQQAAMGKYLAFSRVQESTADATGAKFLRQGGVSGRGMLSFFQKLQKEEYRYGYYGTRSIDPFAQTHPLSEDRIAALTADVQASPAYNTKTDPALDERFRRVKAKLRGYVQDPKVTLSQYPDEDQSIYAHYARAYAWHKSAYPEKAQAEAAALVKTEPTDPYFLEVQGQILLESGDPKAAIPPLREATELTRNQALIATTFGHALIATEDKANYPEAIRVLRQAVARDDDNPFGWYELGMVYSLTGDEAHAALAIAEQSAMTGQNGRAAQSARAAMQGLQQDSPDWLRAQDIAMTTPEGKKKKR